MRHLTDNQSLLALKRGARIEQMLTRDLSEGKVRWLVLEPGRSGVALRLHEVHDTGNANFVDVYEFPPLDEEEHHGEGRLVALCLDEDSALRTASSSGGSPGRWVNAGVVQDEYADLRQQSD
ncbi:MAG: hypothetical protein ACSLEW_14155 [Nocardioides sp.]